MTAIYSVPVLDYILSDIHEHGQFLGYRHLHFRILFLGLIRCTYAMLFDQLFSMRGVVAV